MQTDNGTGWERHRRTHFDEIVAKYDKVRPEYPRELIDDVIEYSGLAKGKKALEIGAGTGKATIPFLEAGYDVTAVEVSANMTDFLIDRFKGKKNFHVITSTFEDALLAENNYDLIYAASAFHWVDPEIGCPKAFRLLKNGGAIALLRYNFNYIPPDGEELSEEIHSIYEKYMYSFYTWRERSDIKKMTKKGFEEDPKIRTGYGFEDLKAYGFSDVSMRLYETTLMYDADDWIVFLDTMANHRNLPVSNKASLYAGVNEAIIRHGGFHKIDCLFQLYTGRKK